MSATKNKEGSISLLSVAGIILFLTAFSYFCWIVNYPLILPLVFLFCGIHLYFFKKASFAIFAKLGLLLALIIFTTNGFERYSSISPYYIPVAAIGMLTVLLFNDLQMVFIMSFLGSLIVTVTVGGDFGLMLIFFMGSLAGAYAVKNARNRGHLTGAGAIIGAVQIVCLILLYPNLKFILSRTFAVNYLYPLVLNGFIAVFVVMATLKIFEYLYGAVTNFSLIELSDFDQPLLRRMIVEAPGTYHHSLIVGNLAESAAQTIGAHSLLCRVGAYYHDIGKLEKPEYFTENQLTGGNKHDLIEPTLSRLVVMNHVKEGVELAKKYKISPVIVDFIPQHHGTSLMHFFYQRALEEAKEDEEVREEEFRYPGPKPQTKEAAILMLADSVEGATRSIEEPTAPKIEDTVKKVINNKFIDGQLDECNLTLKEIEKISTTFIRVLSAMYHSRVKYPEKKNGHSVKRPSEKTPDKPAGHS